MTETIHCEWVDERLEAFLAGELSDAEATVLQAHLRHCTHCQHAKAQAERIQAGLRAWPRPECPGSVVDTVDKRTQHRARRWPALAAAAAIGALALGLSFTLNPPDPRPSPEEVKKARAELRLALGYIAAAGQLAARDVGRSITGNAMHPISRGLELKLNYPINEVLQTKETRT